MVTIGLLVLVFFNCAKISVTNQCIDDGSELCRDKQGKVQLLARKPVDILIVLDNSRKGQKLNPQITDNLNQFVQCIEPLDWRVGIIPGVKHKDHAMGKLMVMEHSALLENKPSTLEDKKTQHLAEPAGPLKFISPDRENYKQIFADTVSLSSGCDKPPFCYKGKRRPLSALQAFMQNTEEKKLFLRESADLAVVVVSSSDEKRGFFSGPGVSSQEVLSSISLDYSSDKWTALSVTDAGQAGDCIKTVGDFKRTSMGFLSKAGNIVGMVTFQPLVLLGSAVLSYQADKAHQSNTSSLFEFAKGGGGQTFDICKPFFGRAVAYSVLQSVDRESQFPEPCKQFDKSQLSD